MGYLDTLKNKPSFCTMESTVNFCKISNYSGYGYKFPKLQELYHKLFGQNFGNEHDASADVAATFKCFWELKNGALSILSPQTMTFRFKSGKKRIRRKTNKYKSKGGK